MAQLISLDNIGLELNGHNILSNIDLEIGQKEIVTLIGPNGAGKSSLIKVALGLLAPTSGLVTRRDDIHIGYVPQSLKLSKILPLNVRRLMTLTKKASDKEILEALELLGVEHLIDQMAFTLSGGEMQRVLLARAVLRKPDLLVLDEPAQGVDFTGQAELYRLIADIKNQQNCSILMVSHDLHLVMAETDRVICLNRHICCHGHPEDVSQHQEYQNLFGPDVANRMAVYTHHHDHQHDMSGNILDHQSCDHDHGAKK